LIEIMLALVIGLVMSLALAQIFTTAKSTYLSQNASASVQEDARFVLAKMVQEIRLAGMFGCLGTVQDSSAGGRFSDAFNVPVQWEPRQHSLTLMTAAVGAQGSWHEWVVHTDCITSATAWSRGRAPALTVGEIALPVQRHVYRLNEQRNELTLDGQPLLSNVRAFGVLFGVADSMSEPGIARYSAQPDPARIRSMRLTLTLFDPADRTQEQTFNVVAAIRNRLG
jgi:type IV pilus assembly protein PilW